MAQRPTRPERILHPITLKESSLIVWLLPEHGRQFPPYTTQRLSVTGITGLPFTGLTRPIGGVCEVCRSLPLFVVHSRLSCRGVWCL